MAFVSSLYRHKSSTATHHDSAELTQRRCSSPPQHRLHLLNRNDNRSRNVDRFVSDTTHCRSQRDYALRDSLLELRQQQYNSEKLYYSNAYAAAAAERLYGNERGIMRPSASAFSSNTRYPVSATAAAFPSSRKRYLIDQLYREQEARFSSTEAEHAYKRIKLQNEQERKYVLKDSAYDDAVVGNDDELLRMKRNRNFNISSLLGLEDTPTLILPENNPHISDC